VLLLYFIAAGLLLGRLTGGRLDELRSVRINWWWVALAGLAFQVVLFSAPVASRIGELGPPLYVASSAAVFVALLPNMRIPGFRLIAGGAMLNLIAIVTNGGYMPSSSEAWVQLNGEAVIPATGYTNSSLIERDTFLPFLGDILTLPRPLPLANVFSIGDVLIGLGATWFLVRAMRGVQPRAGAATQPSASELPLAHGVPGTRTGALIHATSRSAGGKRATGSMPTRGRS
jgi:hypothetical protein